MTAVLTQIGPLARRSVARTLRQPAEYVPAIAFPLVLLALLTGGLHASERVAGFPAAHYLDFALGGAFVQGAITNGINSGGALALDVQTNFLRRLGLTAVQPVSLLTAHLAGAVVVGLAQAVVFLSVGLAFGVRFESGAAGMGVIVLFHLLVTIAFAGVGAFLALRTGSAEVVQGMAPLFVFLMLLSSYLLPRPLLSVDWFRGIATANPLSYLIEGVRSLVITGWDSAALGRFLAIAGVMIALTLAAAAEAFPKRLARR